MSRDFLSGSLPERADAATLIEFLGKASSPAERLSCLRALMNNARLEIAAIEDEPRIFTAVLEHPRHGVFKIGVDPESLDGTTGSLLDVSLALLSSAVQTAAARTIDAHSFDSDDEYRAALSKRTSAFQFIGIHQNAETIRWQVMAKTAGGENFELFVDAVDPDDADFQARWHIATSQSRDPISISNLAGFLGGLYAIEVTSLAARPVDLAELATACVDLITATKSAAPDMLASDLVKAAAFSNLEAMIGKVLRAENKTAALAADTSRPTAMNADDTAGHPANAPAKELAATSFERVEPRQDPPIAETHDQAEPQRDDEPPSAPQLVDIEIP